MSSATAISTPHLGEILSEQDYLRQRLEPSTGDLDYLSFVDLYRVVREVASSVQGDVFDYGCGGTPYRASFTKCRSYIGADFTPGPTVNRILLPDGRTEEKDESYDFVLSAQVLEHVKQPENYLAECMRILKPGGEILVTTHGMFQEHGCPYDFHRWTSNGLEAVIAGAGFTVLRSVKITTEVRAAIQLLHHSMAHLRCPERGALFYSMAVARKLHRWFGVRALNVFGRALAAQGVAPASDPSTLYIGVGVLARKPK